jgi:DNA-binding response OmpR family regulator
MLLACIRACNTWLRGDVLHHGAGGDRAAARHCCDCVVLDVRMPDLDGLTALKLIQSAGAHPPVIMITGHADVPMAVQAMKLGAADFIEKPVDDEELVRSIRTAIERSKRDAEEVSLARLVRERYATLTPREQAVADLGGGRLFQFRHRRQSEHQRQNRRPPPRVDSRQDAGDLASAAAEIPLFIPRDRRTRRKTRNR